MSLYVKETNSADSITTPASKITDLQNQINTLKNQITALNSALGLTKDHGWRYDLVNNAWEIRTMIKNNIFYLLVSGNNIGATASTNNWQDVSYVVDVPLNLHQKAALAVVNKGGQNAAHICLALDPSGMLQYISSASGMYFLGYGAFPLA